jgi:hypothetical protein
MSAPHRVLQHVRVRRPRQEVFQRWLDAAPRLDARIRQVRQDSPLTSMWEVRTLGWARRVRLELLEWRPPAHIRWRASDDSMEGAVSFTDVNRDLTAVRVDIIHRPRTPAEKAAAATGLTRRRWGRALRRFATWVESRPRATGERRAPGPAAAGGASGDFPAPTQAVGLPGQLAVVDGTDGSPGGRGSMGLTSDDVGVGGSVGPADVAGVPPVYP